MAARGIAAGLRLPYLAGMRRLLVLLLLLPLAGCYLSRSADLPDELDRTWNAATVVVPLSRLDPALEDVAGSMAPLEERLAALRPDRRLPLVVFLHGCNGLHRGYQADLDFLRGRGWAVVAPDSFARDYKPRSCEWRSRSAGFHPGVIGFRLAEAEHAVARARAFPWVDPERIVLMGQSEGGLATANYTGDGLAGRVILGWTCQIPWPPLWGLRGDRTAPVLSVVSRDDDWFQRWFLAGDCGRDMGGFADGRSLVLDGGTHHVMRVAAAREAVGGFLDRVAAAEDR